MVVRGEALVYRDWLDHLRGYGMRVIMDDYSFDCILVDPSVIDAAQVRGIELVDGMWIIKL